MKKNIFLFSLITVTTITVVLFACNKQVKSDDINKDPIVTQLKQKYSFDKFEEKTSVNETNQLKDLLASKGKLFKNI